MPQVSLARFKTWMTASKAERAPSRPLEGRDVEAIVETREGLGKARGTPTRMGGHFASCLKRIAFMVEGISALSAQYRSPAFFIRRDTLTQSQGFLYPIPRFVQSCSLIKEFQTEARDLFRHSLVFCLVQASLQGLYFLVWAVYDHDVSCYTPKGKDNSSARLLLQHGVYQEILDASLGVTCTSCRVVREGRTHHILSLLLSSFSQEGYCHRCHRVR